MKLQTKHFHCLHVGVLKQDMKSEQSHTVKHTLLYRDIDGDNNL